MSRNSNFQENLIYSSSRSSKVIDLGVNGKPMRYVTSIVTLAVSATVFEIFRLKDRKLLILATPTLFDAPAQSDPFRILCSNLV